MVKIKTTFAHLKDKLELKFTSDINTSTKKLSFGFNDATIKTLLVTPEKPESEKESLLVIETEKEALVASGTERPIVVTETENRPGTYWNH